MDDLSFVIRPASLKDLDWFCKTAPLFGAGFTSLQNDASFLEKRLTIVEKSFNEQIPLAERIYLFVVEILPQKKIVGISGIDVAIGHKEIFYTYQISHVTQANNELGIVAEHRLLNLVNAFQHASELISLWVDPNYRGHVLSRCLSWARLLFVAQFKEQFSTEILAELRGVSDNEGKSPFWDAVGRKFFKMDFTTADALCVTKDKQFIADLESRMPIYIDLLPLEAQEVIGKEHPSSTPARKLLSAQGFKFTEHVDVFDGGPILTTSVEDIPIVRNSIIALINEFATDIDGGANALLFNTSLNAKFTFAKIRIINARAIIITHATAEILQVARNSQVRYYLFD